MNTNYNSADIGRILGVSRARVAQLRKEGQMPDPTNTSGRPSWTSESIAPWLAEKGRRLDPTEASWLLPGPDMPTPFAPVDDNFYGWSQSRRMSVRRYESLYTATTWKDVGNETRKFLWLCIPHFDEGRLDFSPLDELQTLVRADLEKGCIPHRDETTLRGCAIVTLASGDTENLNWPAEGHIYLLDVYTCGTNVRTEPALHSIHDVRRALDHDIPLWPAVAATAAYIDAWDPQRGPLPVAVAPGLEQEYRFAQLCTTLAAQHSNDTMANQLKEAARYAYSKPYTEARNNYQASLEAWQKRIPTTAAVTLLGTDDSEEVDVDGASQAADWLTRQPDIPAWAAQMAYTRLPVHTRSFAVVAQDLPENVHTMLDTQTWTDQLPPVGQARIAAAVLDHCSAVKVAYDDSSATWWGVGTNPVDGVGYVSVPCATGEGVNLDTPPHGNVQQLLWLPAHGSIDMVVVATNQDGTFTTWTESDDSFFSPGTVARWLVTSNIPDENDERHALLRTVIQAGVHSGKFEAPTEQIRTLLNINTTEGSHV